GSLPTGASRSPMTVIVRSPAASTWVNARRCGSSRHATWSVIPSAPSSCAARRPRSSSPSAVKKSTSPASFTSCPAATAPPPAGSAQLSRTWRISPRMGRCGTRANSTHSICPTTASRTRGSLTPRRPHALEQMMQAVAVPPFERFYEEHRDAVFGLLVKRLGRQAAEDAFQETFFRALRAYPNLRHADHLRAWVLTIAERVSIDAFRRLRPSPDVPDLETVDERPAYEELLDLTSDLPP